MAKRFQNDSHTTNRVPGYYARNKLYKDSYARTEWPTRTSRRIHDGLSIDKNYGLDTVSDDVNSSPYSSPFYINGRYNSSNLSTQRANSASVQGIEKLASIYGSKSDFSDSDIQGYIDLWQGKQIKFKLPYSGKVVGNTITLKNTDACTGVLVIHFSSFDGGPSIYRTAIDLNTISRDKYEHKELYSATVFGSNASLDGYIYVRMEIMNEIEEKRSANPFNTGKKISIAATGLGNHVACEYRLGDKNTPAIEEYNYSPFPSRPCMGLVYNNYTSVPTDRNDDEKIGATVSLNGYKYDIMCCKDDSSAEVLVYDRVMDRFVRGANDSPLSITVDGRAKELNIVQAKDWVYYVDGYSALQKFKIGTWVSQTVTVTGGGANPVIGASIICKHNNRIYLSGFTEDKNLVIFSEITSAGSDYDSYPYRFYSPNISPLESSTNNIVQMIEYENDTLAIFGEHFISLYTTNADVEAETPSQVSTYTDGIGIKGKGDVTNYKGVLYSFDENEGIRRFTGALWNKIPASLDSHIERVDLDKPRKLWGYDNKLYFNYTDKDDGKYKCMIWDMEMNYQQFPWFQDSDVPFCDVRIESDFVLIGIHPDYPCVMSLYAQDTWRRFDSPITFERHTKYISLPGNASDMILKRVHNKVLANSDRWWFFALSYDKHTLEQTRGKDVWYRVPCWDTEQKLDPVESPFPIDDEYEEDAVAILTLPNLRIRAISVQEKIKCETFSAQANLISTVFEAQPKSYL